MNAAALMTADQYRLAAQEMAGKALDGDYYEEPFRMRLLAYAQVYALLAISAQAAENHAETPF